MQSCERPSLQGQLLSNQIWETVAFVAKAAFMLGLTPWMIRVWGAQGYGEFALASAAFVLLSLVDLGIRARTRIALCDDHDRDQWSNILWHGASTFAVIGAGTIAISLLLTASGVFGAIFKISPANQDLLFVTTTMSMLVMTSGLLLEPLIVAGRIGQTKCATAVGWLTSIPCVIIVLTWKGGAIAATTAWLGCLFAANLFVLWLNRQLLRTKLGPASNFPSLTEFVGKLRESFWINVCNATWMTKTYGVTLLIAALSGPVAAGFFFILLRLSEIISALGAVSTDVLLTELAQNSRPEQRRHAFLSSYSWMLIFCSQAGLLIAVFARDFFKLWLHPTTPPSICVGLVIAMLGIASAFNRILTWSAIGLGLAKTAAMWGIAEAVSFIAAILLGSFIFGLLGQLGLAVAATLALVPIARAVSLRLEASLATIWLQPFRDVVPFVAINFAILLAAAIAPLPMAKFIAIPICTGVAFANLSRWFWNIERNSLREETLRSENAGRKTASHPRIAMLNRLIDFGLRSRWLRIAVERLRFRKLADLWLRCFPLVRSLPETGLTYRVRSLNSLGVAHEIFYKKAYDFVRPVLWDVRTIADTGCNAGFFTCFLANVTGNRAIRGLLVDANPEMVREAKWHMDKNRLSQMRVVQGLVGANANVTNEVFYLHSDAACSSCYPSSRDGIVTLTGWRPIQVPVLSLGNEWRKYFGDTPCDLLKVDIEGSEGGFMEREGDFVASVRFLLLEIHHWLVDANLIENRLGTLGFELRNLLPSFHNTDVRLYINRQSKLATAQLSPTARLAHASY